MPVYSYECSFCGYGFDQLFQTSNGSGKTLCLKCGNTAFKIPAVFNVNIYKKKKFADGTETPDFVSSPKQEKAFFRSKGIVLDAPTGREKRHRAEEKKVKSQTTMEKAFKKAVEKTEQGFVIEGVKQKEIKKESFKA